MSQRRLSTPLAAFLVLTSASIAFFIFCGQDFPPVMAIHFGASGQANGYVDRVKFIVLGSFLSFMLPTFAATLVGVLPRVVPASILNMPNKAYWLAPDRKNVTLDTMLWLGLWLGCLLQGFLIAFNISIARANAAAPPTMSGLGASVPIALLAAGLVCWLLAIRRVFRLPRSC